MSHALITGGAGFIGSHLAEKILKEGHKVTIVDNLSSGKLQFIPQGSVAIYSDFADESVLNFVKQSKFDVVYHVAALPSVSYSVEYPSITNDENVSKTVRLLEACRENTKRFVFVSSSAVYGDSAVIPTNESVYSNPKSPYALQKTIGEYYCSLFSDLYKLDTVCVRPFNVFGERQLSKGAYGTVISSWLYAIKNKSELRFDGDGSQSRDMVYVENVVDILWRVGTYSGNLRGEAFNAGSGQKVTNKQIFDFLMKKHPEVQSLIKKAPKRLGDVDHTLADISASQKILGYKPTIDFWDALEKTRQWVLNSNIE